MTLLGVPSVPVIIPTDNRSTYVRQADDRLHGSQARERD